VPAKKTAKKSTKRATKARKQAGARTLSPAHKRALAEGRTLSATVDRYLSSVNTPKRRGRKVPKAALQRRLADARTRFDTAIGVEKVLAAQEIRDLQARIAAIDAAGGEDHAALEAQFVKIAKQFGENRGIGYGAWREAGVPASVLKRARIARTRG
jgi:hypothetical protein